jgi:alkaline phosphatase
MCRCRLTGAVALFGGGSDDFLPPDSYQGKNYYDEFARSGYNIALNKTALESLDNETRAIGVFTSGHLVRPNPHFREIRDADIFHQSKWLDREVYPQNLRNESNSPSGDGSDALDQPGLKDMTLKAIDICATRAKSDGSGFFIMSEAASIDKMMVPNFSLPVVHGIDRVA